MSNIPEYHCTEGHAIQPADWLMVEAYRCRIKDLEGDLKAAEKQGDAAHEACVEYDRRERQLEALLMRMLPQVGVHSKLAQECRDALGSAKGKEVKQ